MAGAILAESSTNLIQLFNRVLWEIIVNINVEIERVLWRTVCGRSRRRIKTTRITFQEKCMWGSEPVKLWLRTLGSLKGQKKKQGTKKQCTQQ